MHIIAPRCIPGAVAKRLTYFFFNVRGFSTFMS